MATSIRVLGIDPGLGITGYGVVEESKRGGFRVLEAGCIRTSKSIGLGDRLKKIYTGVLSLLREYKPDVLALEGLYSHYKHPTSVIMMAHARGAVALAAGSCGIKLASYPATKIKKSITGNGMASKAQVQRAIQGLLGLKVQPEPPDIADALAVGLTHFYIDKKKGII